MVNFVDLFKSFIDKHNKFLLSITMICFVLLTLFGIYTHEPWLDEAQAWLIAQDLNIIELFRYMKYEGHTFVWFLALMPFAKLHIPYPLPMLLLNTLFMSIGVGIFLKKAPFNPLIKALVVFSFPIAYQYSVLARPYAVGIALLFALAALYKEKLNHPYIYAMLIFFCANTSSMALFGAFAFACMFFYEYIKEKKDSLKSKEFFILIGIAISCVIILALQLLGAGEQAEAMSDIFRYSKSFNFFWFMVYQGLFASSYARLQGLPYLATLAYLVLSILCFRKDKKTLFFFLISNLALCGIFLFLYNGYQWHHFFFYMYFIVSMWLYKVNNTDTDKISYKLLMGFFIFSSLSLTNLTSQIYQQYVSIGKVDARHSVAQKIASDENFKNDNIIICDEHTTSVVPYLRNYGIKALSCFDGKEASFFNRSYREPLYLSSKNLTPEKLSKFEDKPMHLLVMMNQAPQLYSDYYKLGKDFCEDFYSMGESEYCLINLTKGYEVENE